MGGEPVIDAREERVTILLDGSQPQPDREAQYRDWAERMRAKRESAQQRIRGAVVDESPSYWRPEDVFRESERVAGEELGRRPDPVAVSEMLAVLGLRAGATPHQIEQAYRTLAKQHHPDRHLDDDENTRGFHADQMRRVNEAFTRLRHLESA
jgi:DnaJ-domain-containing protein 1